MSMGLYIPDLRLPADGDFELWIAVRKDGSFTYNVRGGWQDGKQKAVPVPPHGDLIDASEKIRVQMYNDEHEDFHMEEMTIDDLLGQGWVEADAPTIIPAEEGGA